MEEPMEMYNPAHPGEVLKELYIEPLNLTVTEVAEALGVSRKTLSALVNGHYGVSPDMAMRLAKAFGTTAKLWLNMQQNYDLWQAKQRAELSGVRVLRQSQEEAIADL